MTRGTEPGYRRQPKIYRLVFDEHPGLVVRVGAPSVETFLELAELEDLPDTPETALKMFRMLADRLVGWNLQDDDGQPIPATYESLLAEDWDFTQMLVSAWMQASGGVSAPLAPPSTAGSPSPVESLPMDVRSPSLAS